MSPEIPVKLFPLAARSIKSGGMAVAVLIGLAIFMSQQSKEKAKS